jgi:hypothetical protein
MAHLYLLVEIPKGKNLLKGVIYISLQLLFCLVTPPQKRKAMTTKVYERGSYELAVGS